MTTAMTTIAAQQGDVPTGFLSEHLETALVTIGPAAHIDFGRPGLAHGLTLSLLSASEQVSYLTALAALCDRLAAEIVDVAGVLR